MSECPKVHFVALRFILYAHVLTIFQVPLTPLLPAISVFVNIFLMLRLSEATWVRFAVWMAIGGYFFFFSLLFCIPFDHRKPSKIFVRCK